MLEKITELIVNEVGVDAEAVTLEASFKEDLGVDSLDLFELVMAFEENFGIEIPNEEENVVVKEATPSNKDKLITLLKNVGIDYLDYTSNELNDLIENFDEKEIKENIAFMKEKGLDMDIFINHASMMLDKELKDKVTLLLSIGKDKLDLYLNPSILIKYDLNTLKNVIERIKENQMDPKDVPLMAY